jgi:hypothetical protein
MWRLESSNLPTRNPWVIGLARLHARSWYNANCFRRNKFSAESWALGGDERAQDWSGVAGIGGFPV